MSTYTDLLVALKVIDDPAAYPTPQAGADAVNDTSAGTPLIYPRRVTSKDIVRDAFPGNPDGGEAVIAAMRQITRPAVVEMMRYIEPGQEGVDMGNATVRATVDWMATIGEPQIPVPLTAQQVAALKGLAERAQSPAENIGWTRLVTDDEITAARALP